MYGDPVYGDTPRRGARGTRPRRLLLAAFGDPGHAFPAIALGSALAARGHDVWLETWSRWRAHVEDEGMRFAPAPEYQPFPTRRHALEPYQAAIMAARESALLVREVDPDLIIGDILTVAAGLAAELAGRPWATLVPHLLPTPEPGFPPYSAGARLPRTAAGRALWRALDPLVLIGARRGRDELNEARRRLGLAPLAQVHGGISRRLALVATFPQLEYPRAVWPSAVRVTGPLLWERPAPVVEAPEDDRPLVLVAPSTSQDPDGALLAAALEGLAEESVRVLAVAPRGSPVPVPDNARLVEWLSYAQTMRQADAVVCHAGHGTLARALASGAPVVACPIAGDMAENAARAAWAGAGVSLPRRLISSRAVRLAVRMVLAEPAYARRAAAFSAWMATHDAGAAAADAVEELAGA